MIPSGTGHASRGGCHVLCFLPPVAKAPSGPVESNPAGGGLGGAVARPKRRSDKIRAVTSPAPVRCAPGGRGVPALS